MNYSSPNWGRVEHSVLSMLARVLTYGSDVAGDILDGYHPKGEAHTALQSLVSIFDSLRKPHWHLLGNHCLYNLPRKATPLSLP